ncbi:hypothetical protein [Dyadobacter fermentans]|uniref:Uncharacterized protein n=1 Tax=Dyadobacter fermentans (strain ATCC 700827 / DSM 18053 / CIP 107007 / KCTC 52180 / NS114) TaxID=471854 RepID=C6W3A3_DYAFD|nr:hypothetical protein [Dyadobacter fermentans]ACT92207.1 hypothetical protein Dfer_0956 [Dyadobacter fermentans DSM 18053]
MSIKYAAGPPGLFEQLFQYRFLVRHPSLSFAKFGPSKKVYIYCKQITALRLENDRQEVREEILLFLRRSLNNIRLPVPLCGFADNTCRQ